MVNWGPMCVVLWSNHNDRHLYHIPLFDFSFFFFALCWNRVFKSSKIGSEQASIISAPWFCCPFSDFVKVGGPWNWHAHLWAKLFYCSFWIGEHIHVPTHGWVLLEALWVWYDTESSWKIKFCKIQLDN